MAEEKKTKEQQVKIVWDNANMKSSYVNACNVAASKEEVVLFLGVNQSWDADQSQLTVQLSDRVLMNPFAAKRLSTLLNKVLADYEAQYGKLER